MKEKVASFLELVCFAVGAFLISFIVVEWLFVRLQFTMSPQLCLIVGALLVCGGFVIKSLRKKSK